MFSFFYLSLFPDWVTNKKQKGADDEKIRLPERKSDRQRGRERGKEREREREREREGERERKCNKWRERATR
jgi:hypothetical protein